MNNEENEELQDSPKEEKQYADLSTVEHIQNYIDAIASAVVDKLANLDDQIEEVADQLESRIDEKIDKKLKERNKR